MGPSKFTQDRTDWKRFKDWVTAKNPFTFEDSNLHLLSAGFISIAGKDEINCDDSGRIGANIQAGMDGKSFTEVRFKRNDQAKPLDWYHNTVTIDEVKVYINSAALFTRLAAIVKKRGERRVLLLIRNDQRVDKPSLQKALVTDEESNKVDLISGQNNYSQLMDGGLCCIECVG